MLNKNSFINRICQDSETNWEFLKSLVANNKISKEKLITLFPSQLNELIKDECAKLEEFDLYWLCKEVLIKKKDRGEILQSNDVNFYNELKSY